MTKKALFTSDKQDWTTPVDLFKRLDKIHNFTIDVAASKENTLVSKFFTELENGLIQSWSGEVAWCNPPYNNIKNWIRKAHEESYNNCKTVMLIPARTDTKAFHDYIYKKENVEIIFLKGRLKFSNSLNSAPFPSMIVVFNPIKK